MSRVQLALNVDDLDAAVAFYSTLFDAEPAKRRPGYANFALEDPALKLVLIESPGAGGTLNHLGVEVATTGDVVAQTRRLGEAGLVTRVEDNTTCCYARQDKVWVAQPGAGSWEIYTVLADAGADYEGKTLADVGALPVEAEGATCCATAPSGDKPAVVGASTVPCCGS